MGNARKTVAITGINGLVGSYVAKGLLEDGYDVIGCALEKECVIPGVEKYSMLDITDKNAVQQFFIDNPCDIVIHLAALVHQRSSNLSAENYQRINVQGSKNVFQSASQSGVKSILFASSVEVYGDSMARVIDEQTPCAPDSAYGKSKFAAEKTLESTAGIRYATMRFAPVYAKEFTLNIDKRIYIKPKSIAYYFKNGAYTFNFCSIHNIVSFIRNWLDNGDSGVYLISDQDSFSAKQIIALEKQAGRAKVVLWLPYSLAKLGIGMLGFIRKMLGKTNKDSFFNRHNFEKLFASRVWDSSKARAILGSKTAYIGSAE